jgi:hypothetical protein
MDLGAETNLCVDLHYASRGEERSLDRGTSHSHPHAHPPRTAMVPELIWNMAPCAIGVRMFSLAGTTEDRIGERGMDAAEVADDAQE